MSLPPFRDQRISLADAADLARRFRQDAGPGAEKGGFFFRKLLDEILAQPGCSGVRFYHGKDAKGAPALVIVGVDADGNDITGGTLMDLHYPCPPVCGGGNALNT
jgi:hypothetical protein